jgi:hypothetical protein
MTPVQTVVLIVMGIMVIGLLGVLAKLVFDMMAAIDSKSIVQPTSRPSPLGTSTPTPTPTLTPTPTVEPGWTLYEYPDDGYSITLPESWEAVDEELEEGEEFHMWIASEKLYSEAEVLAIVAGREYAGKVVQLDQLAEWVGEDETILSQKQVSLPIGAAQRMQLQEDDLYGVVYLSPQGKYVYTVLFMYSDPEVGNRNKLTFEKVAKSFRVMGELVATPTPVLEYDPISPDCMPGASWVEDVSVPDGTVFAPGEPFTKTWRIRSDGCAPLPKGTQLVFDSGDRMGGPRGVSVPRTEVDDTVDISIGLTAPDEPGTYQAYWQLETYDGVRYGEKVYLRIVVR